MAAGAGRPGLTGHEAIPGRIQVRNLRRKNFAMNCREFGVALRLKTTKANLLKLPILASSLVYRVRRRAFQGWTDGGGLSAEWSSIGATTAARQKQSCGAYRDPGRRRDGAGRDGRNRGRRSGHNTSKLDRRRPRARRAFVDGRRGHLRHHRPGPPADREGPGDAVPAHRAGARVTRGHRLPR